MSLSSKRQKGIMRDTVFLNTVYCWALHWRSILCTARCTTLHRGMHNTAPPGAQRCIARCKKHAGRLLKIQAWSLKNKNGSCLQYTGIRTDTDIFGINKNSRPIDAQKLFTSPPVLYIFLPDRQGTEINHKDKMCKS